jgi:hypothetical protein
MDPEGTEGATDGLDDIDIDVAAEILGDEGVAETVAPTEGITQPAVEDPYGNYGGKETVESAYRMYQAAQTEDGVVRLWLEAGKSLGLGLREMEQLVSGGIAQAQQFEQEPAEEEDPDRVLTFREFQEMQNKQIQQSNQAQQQQAQQAARNTVSETFAALGVNGADPSAQIILQLSDKYLKGPDDLSPESVRAAVQRGHADFQVLVAAEAKNYLRQKVATKGALPKSPSGSAAPSTAPTEEPKSIEEAFARVRKQLGR